VVAATAEGAELVDPRPFAVGTIAETLRRYPHIGPLLPAMGYGNEQIAELEETINASGADALLVATPIDLTRLLSPVMPVVRATYSLAPRDGGIEEAMAAKGFI
jgi:predicted GTPase